MLDNPRDTLIDRVPPDDGRSARRRIAFGA